VHGDAARPRVLERAGAAHAALAVVALPEIERAHRTVRHLRALNPRAPVLARAQHPAGVDGLRRAGATEVIQPETEAAATMIRHSLRGLGQPAEQTLAYLSRLRAAMEPASTPTPAVVGSGQTGAVGIGGAAVVEGLPVVREILVGAGSLADQSLGEARIRERFGVTVLAVHRPQGEPVLNPSADTLLRHGDRVRAFGLPAQLDALAAAADDGAAYAG
jgi:CPA2 family monovalent cation:H+ antiporter-2